MSGLQISDTISIPDSELEFAAIRAQGAGGQNVNKVASAIHLRFDIRASKSLPDVCKQRLLALQDQRISGDGVVVIKAQQHRSQEKNRAAALERLRELIQRTLVTRKPRKAEIASCAGSNEMETIIRSKTFHGFMKNRQL